MPKPFISKRQKIVLSGIGVLFILWFFSLPKSLFKDPTSTVVTSRENVLLGARIADDGQWRFPQLDNVPKKFETCILAFEDRYFYQHFGFNPMSMTKALYENLTSDSRRGGSTITQQVIRLSRKNQRRTYLEKFIELIKATRLEAGHSKAEILNLYATYAPFGGNVVGLETASWRYFGIPASQLTWAQSASLAILPNAPSLIFPGKNEDILLEKRNRLLKILFQQGELSKTEYDIALLEPLPLKPLPLPDVAPHLVERMRNEHPGKTVNTTVNLQLQNQLNQIAEDHYLKLKQNQIHNLAILVMDVNTKEVLGYVGNSPTTPEHQNSVDIITSNRSTGSVLKPFLFASLLDDGLLLPNTLVEDIPTTINGYQPQNFNRDFQGAVPASQALARSLNIPAVRLLQDYGLDRFYNKLKQTPIQLSKDANHYGLTLILGGAESTLWDLTSAYAGLASTVNFYTESSSEYNTMEFSEAILTPLEDIDFGEISQQPNFADAGSIYKTLEALQEVNRPEGEENWTFYENSQPFAWKTGTSYGFKDAWAIGVTPQYGIGVWTGNADGEGRAGLTGITTSAPILFDVLNILPSDNQFFSIPYDALTETEICTQSGYKAGLYCNDTTSELIPIKGDRTESCPFHKQIFLDKLKQFQVNSSCYDLAEITSENRLVLPPIQSYYYSKANPNYQSLPPFAENCLSNEANRMAFIYPKGNDAIILPKDFDEETNDVVFKIAHSNPDATVFWYLDETFIGETTTFHELSIQPKRGAYRLMVVDDEGFQVVKRIRIE